MQTQNSEKKVRIARRKLSIPKKSTAKCKLRIPRGKIELRDVNLEFWEF